MLPGLGKTLILLGLFIVVVGLVLLLAGRFPWLGRLPGDILVRRGNVTFYFPLATCILVSVIVSLLMWLWRR